MKRLYLFAILLVASVSLMAQEIMKVQLTDGSVIEYNVTKVARVYFESKSILGNYNSYLNKTKNSIIESFGNPLFEEDRRMYYVVSDSVVDYCVFSLYEDIDVCQVVSLLLKDKINNQQIIDELNSTYFVFEKGTEEDGSFYAWINTPDLATSTVGITYDPVNKVITYLLLEPSAGVPEKQISNVKKYSKIVRLPIQK